MKLIRRFVNWFRWTPQTPVPSLQVKELEWQVPLACSGNAGDEKDVSVLPCSLGSGMEWFMGEKLIATDTSRRLGMGTKITGIYVGQQSQMHYGPGALTYVFGQNCYGNGFRLDKCRQGIAITVKVKFLEDCTFNGCIFGKVRIVPQVSEQQPKDAAV